MAKSLSELLIATRELRAGSVITENEINALKRRWKPRPMGRLTLGGEPVNAQDECEKFMGGAPYHISAEQAEKGFAWWRAQCFTATGKRRDTSFTRRYLTEGEWAVVATGVRFELVDWFWEPNGYGTEWPFPVYRMLTAEGKSFDYVAKAWQSGGAFIL